MNHLPPLPEDFLVRMRNWLGPEYEEFLHTYNKRARKGLRVNLLKCNIAELQESISFLEANIPWCQEGFYYSPLERAGNHPFHQAGLYYLQEPSAMSVVSALDPKPGDWLLDLCAAPGGKSTQIAARLNGQGILWANEPNPSRLKVLAENIERLGVSNCIISNESPDRLARKLPGVFDKILVDAPCSGEGMFRKDPQLRAQWTWRGVQYCAERQKEILSNAVEMLKPNGILVYSTCTFNPVENEGVVDWLLKKFPEIELISHPYPLPIFDLGHPEWLNSNNTNLIKCIRLWPHRLEGEGHFLAVLRKNTIEISKIKTAKTELSQASSQLWQKFAQENLNTYPGHGIYFERNNHLFWLPQVPPDFTGLKILRPGLLLGNIKANRFEPAHSTALAWPLFKATRQVTFYPDSIELISFFKGQTLISQGRKGWLTVTVNGYPVGWGKDDGNLIKNHYPKGLR